MSFLKKIILSFVFIALLLTGYFAKEQLHAPIVKAEEVTVQEEPQLPLTPIQAADKYTKQYGVDPVIFKKVMFCESSNNPDAVGDHGLARNVMQFHKPTFDSYAKLYGKQLSYDSYEDQIELAAWMFSNGEQHHWTCYSTVTGK